jgi:hypothetical protein
MVNPKPLKNAPPSDLAWGSAEIGAETGLRPGQVYYFFATGRFGDAVWKFSPRKLVGSRKRLRELQLVAETASAK